MAPQPNHAEAIIGTSDVRSKQRLQRASRLFVLKETALESPFVERIWRTESAPADAFISIAASHSEIVFTKHQGRTFVTVRGPETRATVVPIPVSAEFFGIQLKPGVFWSTFPASELVDRSFTLPGVRNTFCLNSSTLEIPDFHNLDVFIEQLVRDNLLRRDPIVESVLIGPVKHLSVRSAERRFLRASGLTQGMFRQIQRALRAAELLDQGVSILETVQHAGYADQAHLTRSLKRFIGQTPGQILREPAVR